MTLEVFYFIRSLIARVRSARHQVCCRIFTYSISVGNSIEYIIPHEEEQKKRAHANSSRQYYLIDWSFLLIHLFA